MKKLTKRFWRVLSLVIFAGVFAVLFGGLGDVSSGSAREGVDITKEAVERAAVVCYATEGFYPPSLSYIEENYDLQIDHNSFLVRYEVFASNVMPQVTVFGRDSEGGFR